MTNEWKEFLAYTGQPDYSAARKSDTHWMSRFTMKMILDMLGYHRVLTIIARGYLFHEPDGSLKAGDPYERIEYARNALCAWCSIPVIEKSDPQTNFGALADMFPELVDAAGFGWPCTKHGTVHGRASGAGLQGGHEPAGCTANRVSESMAEKSASASGADIRCQHGRALDAAVR